MSYKTQEHIATGAATPSPLIKITRKPENFKCLIHVIVTSGTPTYEIEYSINGVDYIVLNGLTAQTASTDTTLVFPVHSLRAKVTAGTGTVKLIVLHNDGDGNA
ncbi:hypothetical protein NVP1077O_03 [Vibrio phage 1.077.O._10N.261.45.A10]|nr:hypothetical protein NVP1077O_03 [Vibrio phage 1.077.O._10N.261.45.A10]